MQNLLYYSTEMDTICFSRITESRLMMYSQSQSELRPWKSQQQPWCFNGL